MKHGTPPVLPFPASLVRDIQPVGSRFTVEPPPSDTDEDWLVLVTNFQAAVEHLFNDEDWTCCGSYDGDDLEANVRPILAFRWKHVNVIVTEDNQYFRMFLVARDICKKLNVQSKEDRAWVHQRVRDSTWGDEMSPKSMTVEDFIE